MIADRLVVLVVAAAVGAALYGLYALVRRRWGARVERLDIDELGLELISGCCAFVVFTTPACQPCKSALHVVTAAAAEASAPTEVTTVDAMERTDLALRYDVRTIPTTFLITASGHVVERWRHVPERASVDAALALL
ncbi:MAG: thioredoxin domain-containing protein [Actinomycetota bacterium]|nr:thioredoxin domain-containing protein [Actinomycetota bacterium]